MEGEPGDLLMFLADTWEVTCKGLSGLRKRLAAELKLIDPKELNCSWITEFPMFERDEEQVVGTRCTIPSPRRWPVTCRCWTMIRKIVVPRLTTWSSTAVKQAAERSEFTIPQLAIEGLSSCSGSTRKRREDRFGFLLNALKFGAPPHGGIALGVDRWVMLFAGLDNIREVIAFPKTQKATDLMTEAPGQVDKAQLAELHLRTAKVAKV